MPDYALERTPPRKGVKTSKKVVLAKVGMQFVPNVGAMPLLLT